ncbi:transposase [Flavobacterium hydrocarbonoxydans]|nr:transposase [Flavobacterium hydrocarbonoxydans]
MDQSNHQISKKNRRVYERTFKEKAVLLSYERSCIEKVGEELGITKSLLNKWRKDFKKYGERSFPGHGNLLLNPEEEKIYLLKKRIKKAELDSFIIQTAAPYLSSGKLRIYFFIQDFEKNCSAKRICKVLGIAQRSYSRWKNHYISERNKRKIELLQVIATLFITKKKRYGPKRITVELRKRGYILSISTTARYMKELGLFVSIKKP